MKNVANIMITQDDYQKLSSLLKITTPEIAELLEEELERAEIVPLEKLPENTVKMNSEVQFVDLDSGKDLIVNLVYPHESNVEENKISILAPVGSALIGLKVGQVIHWPVPNGKVRKLKVVSVTNNPNT